MARLIRKECRPAKDVNADCLFPSFLLPKSVSHYLRIYFTYILRYTAVLCNFD